MRNWYVFFFLFEKKIDYKNEEPREGIADGWACGCQLEDRIGLVRLAAERGLGWYSVGCPGIDNGFGGLGDWDGGTKPNSVYMYYRWKEMYIYEP